ncbi:MAG: beta-glucoside operon transcriptional antiterminator [Chloroflexota bacterium]|nr:beta-glucoside operon transcriptional antiterminator [Chloroflexota bacterium]
MQKGNKPFIISKILNNNVAVSFNQDNQEVVVMGKGISFSKKVGDVIDPNLIEKVFILTNQEKSRFLDLVENIPSDFVEIAMEIMDFAEESMQSKLNAMGCIMLSDHIFCAIERQGYGKELKNEMLGEIKSFYPQEYKVGVKALEIIKKHTGKELSLDEAGFIAIHILNSSGKDYDNQNSVERIKLIDKIIEIVESDLSIELDRESYYFERFVVHLKYLSHRIFNKDEQQPEDDFAYRMLKNEFTDINRCVARVQEHIETAYGIRITNEEKGYLILHIYNLLKNKKENGGDAK